MRPIARLLVLAGAGAVVVSALLPWVTIDGPSLHLDLGVIGAAISPGDRTVAGTGTSVWPALVVVGGLVAALAALDLARRLLVVVGLLVAAAGAGLLYYVNHVITIEASKHDLLVQALTPLLLHSRTGPGPAVLIAGGIAITLGALAA
jgi:hypothetical protein